MKRLTSSTNAKFATDLIISEGNILATVSQCALCIAGYDQFKSHNPNLMCQNNYFTAYSTLGLHHFFFHIPDHTVAPHTLTCFHFLLF